MKYFRLIDFGRKGGQEIDVCLSRRRAIFDLLFTLMKRGFSRIENMQYFKFSFPDRIEPQATIVLYTDLTNIFISFKLYAKDAANTD